MRHTWGEIQIQSIQKMFINNVAITVEDLDEMRTDKKYATYLNMMPAAATEGLLRLNDAGKPIVNKYDLYYNLPNDVLQLQDHSTYQIVDDNLEVLGTESHSYYFEINNNATVEIQLYENDTWTTVKTINAVPDITNGFTVYKGRITNDNNVPTKIIFNANGYIYEVRNIAIYKYKFRTDDEVYDNTFKQKYDLKDLVSDFYQLISVEYEPDNKIGKYNSDYILEGDDTLVIDSSLKGHFIITYRAYPTKITEDTSDSYRFELDPEMITLLPLYIASELYKYDDISLATQYRNQFESGLAEITNIEEPLDFADNAGWL